MNRIERYLAQVVVSYTLLVMLVLLVIFGFFEFMNQVGKLTDTYTLAKGSLYTLLKLPVYSYEIFPIVLVIGTLMGLGSLANQSELTVLRVTGWSIKRILWTVLKTAFMMWIVIAVIGEWVAPNSEAYAKKLRAEALNQSFSVGSGTDLWVKDSDRYIHVGRVLSSTDLRQITIYELYEGRLVELSEVNSASYENERWVFNKAVSQYLNFTQAGSDTTSNVAHLELKIRQSDHLQTSFPLVPEELQNLGIETRYLSAWDLYQYIDFLQSNDLETGAHELEFWRKVSMPLVVAAMIAIVFPLIFGSIRQVSMGQRVFLGVLLGMGFHLLNQLVGNLTVVYHWPIILGAFLPALLLLVVALFWLQRAR
ncbi:MAG: lipopolysaccharide export system permease protein [Thiomicrorhabdus sp.]|nr:MAG: lipopolysaccharide export system permease protein [Thiomicrorhabdus sp.]